MTTAYTIPDVKPQKKKQCGESGFIKEVNIGYVVIAAFVLPFFFTSFPLHLLAGIPGQALYIYIYMCVCVCVVYLYDMSLGSVLLGYFYRFPSTEISEHFLVHVIIIKTSMGSISQGIDDFSFPMLYLF